MDKVDRPTSSKIVQDDEGSVGPTHMFSDPSGKTLMKMEKSESETAINDPPIDKSLIIDIENYPPEVSDAALSTKIKVLGLSGFLLVLGTAFVVYTATDMELCLLLIPFMLVVTYAIYLVFYYLI